MVRTLEIRHYGLVCDASEMGLLDRAKYDIRSVVQIEADGAQSELKFGIHVMLGP